MDAGEMWRAVHRMEAAADKMSSAASTIDEAASKIRYLLEDGYGGSGLRLIELLEELKLEDKT